MPSIEIPLHALRFRPLDLQKADSLSPLLNRVLIQMGIEGGTFEDKRQLFLQRVFDSCNTSFAVGAVVESLSLADNKSHIVTAAPEDSQEVLIKKHEGREK